MRKLSRKILSALLALALLVSLIPAGAAPALAAEPTPHDISQSTLSPFQMMAATPSPGLPQPTASLSGKM